jgi:hypothetical protein
MVPTSFLIARPESRVSLQSRAVHTMADLSKKAKKRLLT